MSASTSRALQVRKHHYGNRSGRIANLRVISLDRNIVNDRRRFAQSYLDVVFCEQPAPKSVLDSGTFFVGKQPELIGHLRRDVGARVDLSFLSLFGRESGQDGNLKIAAERFEDLHLRIVQSDP